MRKLIIFNILLIFGFSAYLVFIVGRYHPTIALNRSVQSFAQNPSKTTYQAWFDNAAYNFGELFLSLSPEQQIIKFDEFAQNSNTSALIKVQTLNAQKVQTSLIEQEIEQEIIEIGIPKDTEIVITQGEAGKQIQLEIEFPNAKSGTFIAAELQKGEKRKVYKGNLEKSEFILSLNKELETIYSQIESSNLNDLEKTTDLKSAELNSLLRRRPDALAMLKKTKVADASWQNGEIAEASFQANLVLQTENCPRDFILPLEFITQEKVFKVSNVSRLILDLCSSEGIIPLTCTNCALAPVDKVYKLSKDYVPNVVNTNLPGGGRLTPETVAQLKQMFEDAARAGAPMKVFSAYRSYQDQVGTFDYWYKRELARGLAPAEARISANRYSALPGHSEHQLGTTVDVGCDTCTAFDNSPGNLKAYAFIEAHAHKYGFVVSYPKGTTNLTGYNYEPWHLRYVGIEIATELFNKGYLKQNGEYLAKLLVQKQQY